MNSSIGRFILRWFVSGLGIWIAAALLGSTRIDYDNATGVIVIAGLLLAVVNTVIKPLIIILSLPAILFSLGLFMIVINGLMLLLVSAVYPQLHVQGFVTAMIAGMVIGLVNYLVTTIFDHQHKADKASR